MVYWWIPTHGEKNAEKMARTIKSLQDSGVLPLVKSFKASQDYKNTWGVQLVFEEVK